MAGRSVTSTTLPVATLPEVRQLVASAITRNTDSQGHRHTGVIGLRARREWAGATEISHEGVVVRIALCASALAVREALRNRSREEWLVVITDRPESDLGAGILTYLQNQALRNPDPWNAVREQFAADRIDRRLVTHPRARDLAAGFLAARGEQPWLPARGGLLTYDHAFGSVVGRWLDLGHASDPVTEDVLRWSAKESQALRVTDLRRQAGEVVTSTALEWLASRCGRGARVVEAVIGGDKLDDLVPLGLAGRAVLACPDGSEPWGRLPGRLGIDDVTRPELTGLVEAAERVVRDLVLDDNEGSRRQVGRVLHRADALVAELRADSGIEESLLLHGSLTARLAQLGESLDKSVATAGSRAATQGADSPLADPARLDAVEKSFARVQEHLLARLAKETRVPRALAAVRLVRWLGQDLSTGGERRGLTTSVHRHRDDDAWVDRAYGDVWRGVDEPQLSRALGAVAGAVRLRREQHDDEFAAVLAAFTESPEPLTGDVVLIEDLLAQLVVPLARQQQPVLVIVADGMSAAVGTEIVDDIEGHYDSWTECLPAGQARRTTAVAALPSLTEVSRCSLLSGTLATGQQSAERTGFAELMRAHGLTSALFHKLSLETSGAGTDLAPDVRVAVDDVAGLQVVACVLNTIDDALDRSDPGIDWTTDAVSHLRPLMERARRAGRVVVLTSDHGHVVERREGRMQHSPAMSSNRSRPFDGSEVNAGELRVRGRRVLQHEGDAVLAVDEQLRYGPLKAGYHGGAAPAEVVIPVHVLTSGESPRGWDLAPPQVPSWWQGALAAAEQPLSAPAVVQLPASELPTLFDTVDPDPAPVTEDFAARVIGSAAYVAQRARATRVTLGDDRIEALLRIMLNAPGHRVDPWVAATALGVAKVHVSGAVPMLQRLLNIEQYPVLDRDPDGQTLVLDPDLLAEQFGVPR